MLNKQIFDSPYNIYIDVRDYNSVVEELKVLYNKCENNGWISTKEVFLQIRKLEYLLNLD